MNIAKYMPAAEPVEMLSPSAGFSAMGRTDPLLKT